MKTISARNFLVWMTVILLVSLTVACTPVTPSVEDFPSETAVITEDLPATEPVQEMTATPAASTVILAYDSGADPFAISQTQSALEQLLTDGTMTLVIREGLSEEMLTPNVEVIVGVGPLLNLGDLARSVPAISFIAVDNPGIEPAENLNVIGGLQVDQQQQAFMAGYLAALVSEDSKVAVLVPSEGEESNLILNAFFNGARFFCGICRPLYPPYNSFPQWEILSPENAQAGFETVVDSLVTNGVEIVYVPGDLATPELLSYLAEWNIQVVGDSSPEILRNNWVATVKADPSSALKELWPDLISGAETKQMSSSIVLDETDSGLVTEGRLLMFQETAESLQAGLISPGELP